VPAQVQSVGVCEPKLNSAMVYQLRRRPAAFARTGVGRRMEAIVNRRRGKYSRSRQNPGQITDVAIDATLRAAAARSAADRLQPFQIRTADLRAKIRRHRSPYVIVFVVDNSWSIQVDRTLDATKGVVLALLKDARVHRDRIALVAFRHGRRPDGTVCLAPTSSFVRAAERLAGIPLTGSTPLPDALSKAYRLVRQTKAQYQNAIPVMVILSDGLPNVAVRPGADPYEEVRQICRCLGRDAIPTVVVDTEPGGRDAGLSACREMALLSGGSYLPLSMLSRESLEQAVAGQLGESSSIAVPEPPPKKRS
jgi:Mg-chelatase subunit ChlD